MGIIYIPVPLGEESVREFLIAEGFSLPDEIGESRNPTVQELRFVLDNLDEFDVSYCSEDGPHSYWEADVEWAAAPDEGPWAVIRVLPFDGDESVPTGFCFSKGWEEAVVLILERIARICGPFVLLDDSAMEPLLVTPGLNVDAAIQEWNARIEAHTVVG